MSIYGFSHTNIGLIIKHCKGIVGANGIQIVTQREALVRRRCYIILGVNTLDTARIKILNQSTSVLVIVDALPDLLRIHGISVLDAPKNTMDWQPIKVNFTKLDHALYSPPKPLSIIIDKDTILDNLIAEVKNRSILDQVLSAAKSMDAPTRAILHVDVARLLAGKISAASFRKRCESRNSSGRLFEKMINTLSGETAKRLSAALREAINGAEIIPIAKKYNVESSEIRFLHSKLKDIK